jgi:hypothetical protein
MSLPLDQKLVELRKRYAWFDAALGMAHANGKVNSAHVRFLVLWGWPQLLDTDLLEYHDDPSAEPYYFGRVQAYDYVGDPPSATISTQIDIALELLDRTSHDVVLGVACEDLNAHLARLRATP